MKIYMYEQMPNFGDALNKYLWPHYFRDDLERDDNILMFGIGTLLGQTVNHKGPVIVCGSGCGYERRISHIHKENWKIFFVRGPLTARILGLPEEMGITDPAILTPDVIEASPPTGATLFIPHWETSFNPLWRYACQLAGMTYVDPLAPVHEVTAKISGARLVISEAMHGAILADAYRVPWIPVSTSPRINRFKWTDWAKSICVNPEIYCLPPLGMSDFFRALTVDSKTSRILKNAADIEDDILMLQTGDTGSGRMTAWMNKVYASLVPGRFQPGIGGMLSLKAGPGIDRYFEKKMRQGRLQHLISRPVSELRRLAAQPGWLSSDHINNNQKARIGRKLQEARDYIKDIHQIRQAAVKSEGT